LVGIRGHVGGAQHRGSIEQTNFAMEQSDPLGMSVGYVSFPFIFGFELQSFFVLNLEI
jgi:hypothetical protein